MSLLDRDQTIIARGLAKRLAESWSVIPPSEILRTRAMEIVDRYDLRAGDSLQLAAALEWCESDPQGRVFLTADKRLRDAALLSGFDAPQV
jgi:predicted nucleic acid-binding protein